jgi:hypothetical protein
MTFSRGNFTGRRLAPEWVFHPPRYGDSRPRLRLRRRRRRKCRSASAHYALRRTPRVHTQGAPEGVPEGVPEAVQSAKGGFARNDSLVLS